MLRWLLPIVAALAMLGQAVTAWAASGRIGEATCCCPAPKDCKCHDHEGSGEGAELRRCTGEAKLVAPAPLVAAPPPLVVAAADDVAAALPELPAPAALPSHRSDPPEKPPF